MTEISPAASATSGASGLTRAHAAIEAALARAESLGVALAVVVVDAGGLPVATRRMAGAAPETIDAGAARAATAVLFARSTKALARMALPGTLPAADGGDTAAFDPGGAPLTDASGRADGAVGVSGGTPEQDHQVAMAAARAATAF
jgi:uncharacterized protein GlcG (DUF336 family)